jgi:hypothetical protein
MAVALAVKFDTAWKIRPWSFTVVIVTGVKEKPVRLLH